MRILETRLGRIFKTLCFLVLIIPILVGCGGGSGGGNTGGMQDYLNDPNYPQDFWITATPEEVGLDSDLLTRCTNTNGVSSMLVIRNDKLVFERYGTGYLNGQFIKLTPNIPTEMQSVTKSITSALIGIALNEGSIQSLQDTVLSYFPEYTPAHMTPDKAGITIEDMLTMRSGLQWVDGSSDNNEIWISYNSFHYAMDKIMVAKPGAVFNYSTGNADILTHLIYRTTGELPENYAREKLFGPLGITNFHWAADGMGVNFGGTQIYLCPRDMAKFGYLYLKQGVWKGSQVIPSSWVALSTQQHVKIGGTTNYGYYWWIYTTGGYEAIGAYGQRIIIYPNKNLIIVFTSHLGDSSVLDKIGEQIARSVQ